VRNRKPVQSAREPRMRSARVRVFCSYSHRDDRMRLELEKHLTPLRRGGLIDVWNDRCIPPGAHIDQEIDIHLGTADIVLLLISPDFIASEYCYRRELAAALRRHHKGETVVIPVILRAVEWHSTPIGKLRALPKDGRPVNEWPLRDVALMEVAQGVRQAVETILQRQSA
jgi:hypothetical protein